MPLGTQLYVYQQVIARTGRDFAAALPEVLGEVAAAGYDGVETMLSLVGDPAADLAGVWAASGLALPSLYAGGPLHGEPAAAEQTIGEVVALAALAQPLGLGAVTFNPQPEYQRAKTEAELRQQAAGLDRLGRELAALGLWLQVHTHAPEMRDDAREFRSLLDLTDPGLVGLCFDTHWVHRGGGDTLALCRQYAARITALHVRQSHDGVWADAFEPGDLAHEPLAAVLAEQGFSGWVHVELALEQGTPEASPLADRLAASAAYARQVFGC